MHNEHDCLHQQKLNVYPQKLNPLKISQYIQLYQSLITPIILVVMKRGHGVSPLFRFLTSSGEWVWQQVEAKLHYKDGTSIPHFWKAKIRVFG